DVFGVKKKEVGEALIKLEDDLENRGIVLIKNEDSVSLGITKELSPLIEKIRKEEVTKDLTKASLEVFSIILYQNGVSRSEIDFIRGVNSSFTLRNLLIRGLIDKEGSGRRFIYKPSLKALSYMGVPDIKELPNYNEVNIKLEEMLSQYE
ncbi:MAG: SMC-Scp complex subunit ScpB, partial [Patescibacteria group bacterium]|nr:SMC-Scp complex subunit ScpB [Patescibacteria group bacterium]